MVITLIVWYFFLLLHISGIYRGKNWSQQQWRVIPAQIRPLRLGNEW
jgi:hypothetical protein